MKTKPYNLLLHPAFLTGLILLLLNDFYLKYEFHNWFTGKLSDFTGLFVFAVFLSALLPKYKKTVTISIALFFLWWKSPLSSALIAFLNTQLHLPIHRFIDYSDYWALSVLPLIFYIKPISCSRSFVQKIAVWCIGILSFFAFSATSMIRKLADDNRVKLDKTITTKKTESEVVNAFKNNGLNPQKDSAIYEKLWRGHYYLKSKGKNGEISMIALDSLYSGVYTKIEYGSIYTIPEMYIAGDTIYNLQLIISNRNREKKEIWLHSFEYKTTGTDSLYFSGYYIWKKLKKPIKKKFKEMVR
jgi:hypothetical protein